MIDCTKKFEGHTLGFEHIYRWVVRHYSTFAAFRSNGNTGSYLDTKFEYLVFAGIRESRFDTPSLHEKKFFYGHLSYDLKNTIEPSLKSSNPAYISIEPMVFHEPVHVFTFSNGKWSIFSYEPDDLVSLWSHSTAQENIRLSATPIQLTSRISKDQYLQAIEQVKSHLHRGDIYEMNFCYDFIGKAEEFAPQEAFLQMQANSSSPFAVHYKHQHIHLLCDSPERFICKRENVIYSQPIKGTTRRTQVSHEDQERLSALFSSEKEKSENVMIVDLVRNDLSKIATKNTVTVNELFGIYGFTSVYQMISTVSASLKPGIDLKEIINALFPMGSMTGAPKISAMQIIEALESFSRGIYSGSVGFILPNGDCDFNVVIRSLVFDEQLYKMQLAVGGAITAQCEAESEFEETLIKAHSVVRHLPYIQLHYA